MKLRFRRIAKALAIAAKMLARPVIKRCAEIGMEVPTPFVKDPVLAKKPAFYGGALRKTKSTLALAWVPRLAICGSSRAIPYIRILVATVDPVATGG